MQSKSGSYIFDQVVCLYVAIDLLVCFPRKIFERINEDCYDLLPRLAPFNSSLMRLRTEIWRFSRFRFVLLTCVALSKLDIKDFETFIGTVTVVPGKQVMIVFVWLVLVEVVVNLFRFFVDFGAQKATREFTAVHVKPTYTFLYAEERRAWEYFTSSRRFVWIGSGVHVGFLFWRFRAVDDGW